MIKSKNNLTDGGFTIGDNIQKDMDDENYTEEFDPANNSDLFPGLQPFINSNIVSGDKPESNRLIASYWNDWGNDVFDDWGYFYIYDVESGKYYFPLINPKNQANGVITTQTINAFDRTFHIKHGFPVQGIFKFEITACDDKPFRFGCYGNMGSDGDELISNLTHSYSLEGNDLTLYYQKHQEGGDSTEILYSYFIPKLFTDNESITYNFYNDEDDNSFFTNEITKGLLVYFSKKNDVKEWIANDLAIDHPIVPPSLFIGSMFIFSNVYDEVVDDEVNYI